MFLGVCIGQYAISTLTYFFLTWFPVYLVQQRGPVDPERRARGVHTGAMRLLRRRARRHGVRHAAAPRGFADPRPEDPHRRRGC
ncbi:MAG: hypothetical protein WDN49_11470 [Acetobacteraceae bacterium]